MCGLKASHVREELVSGTVREAVQGFVYGEIKPPAGVGLCRLCQLGLARRL